MDVLGEIDKILTGFASAGSNDDPVSPYSYQTLPLDRISEHPSKKHKIAFDTGEPQTQTPDQRPLKDRITEPSSKDPKDASNSDSAAKKDNKPSFKDRLSWAFSKKQKAGDLAKQLEQCKTTHISLRK